MKIKLKEVAGYLSGLMELSEKRLPAKVSYAVMKNQKVLEMEYKDLDQQRVKLCETYAEQDENGEYITRDGIYVFSDENRELFSKEYNDVLEEEIEVNIRLIAVGELDKCDESERYDTVTPKDFMTLEFMLKE
ncbi:MAG: hypothetical protein Q4D45_10495 [Lachnospiraceae bacterium]|nr:hypothetical protein [Lachnospiraceae bacterium]